MVGKYLSHKGKPNTLPIFFGTEKWRKQIGGMLPVTCTAVCYYNAPFAREADKGYFSFFPDGLNGVFLY